MSSEALLLPEASEASTPAHTSMFLDVAEFEIGQSAERPIYAQELLSKYGEGIRLPLAENQAVGLNYHA